MISRRPRRRPIISLVWFSAAVPFVGAVLAPAAAQAQKSPLAQAAYARAQADLAASRFADAANEIETAVRFEPRFALGWYVLASASRRANRPDRAVAAYRRYIELRPAEPDPYFGLGLCLQAIGDREAAATALRHYIEVDTRPTSHEYVEQARQRLAELERAGAAAAPTGRIEGGAKLEGTAALAAGGPVSPAVAHARDLRDHGKTDDAIAAYRAAITASPSAAEPHRELGALLVMDHKIKDSVPELRAAVKLAPTEPTAWYNLGFALRESGDATSAVDAYRRFVTLRPNDPDPHYGLAMALVALGREDEALNEFRLYTTMETRLTEKRWVKKARLEITRIESRHAETAAGPTPAAPGTGTTTTTTAPKAPTAPPARTTKPALSTHPSVDAPMSPWSPPALSPPAARAAEQTPAHPASDAKN